MPEKKKITLRRFTKEVVILTIFTELVWITLWSPFGILLSYSAQQWIRYFIFSLPYDFALAYASSKIIIMFDEIAKRRHWY